MDEFDFIHCQNGALLIEHADGTYTLSASQVKILACIYPEGATSGDGCARGDLHVTAFGHAPLRRGRARRGPELPARVKLTAAQRAALSRSLRRLHQRGLIA